MRRVLRALWRALPWVSLTLLASQLAAMASLTTFEALSRKRRKLRRFPRTPPQPVECGRDEVTVYTYGADLYADMLAAIDSAQKAIFFETYIWKADDTGRDFKGALARAADRGVKVYVAFDEFANLVVPRHFLRMPANIAVYRHPLIILPWRPRNWGRDHRKLLIVDHEVGFVGGYNIGSLYATGWRDTHARVVGPAVMDLENAVVDFWNLHAGAARRLPNEGRRPWHNRVMVQRNTPRLQVYPIRNMYLEAIDRAQERIWLTHAYLIPDDDFVGALRDAAKRGADVRIIIPAESNHVVADWLSRGFYVNLLTSGIRLFLYQGAMVHAKTATIDGAWSTIGTANLDRLSLRGNYEINLEITDSGLADLMEQIFTTDLSNTIELKLEDWRGRSVVAKGTELLLSPWRPLF